MIIQSAGYKIFIADDPFGELRRFLRSRDYTSCFIICDENSMLHCLPILVTACPALSSAGIIETESGEQNKTLDIAAQVWQTMAENHADRKTLVVNLGGGVITDLGGFCASVYKRGVDFINIPTTLLGMVDASVGAKNGLDFLELKNLIGTFTEPEAVFISPVFLETLPYQHIMNGMAEVYKMALVSDKKFWKALSDDEHDNDPLKLITRNVKLKNEIVKKDPFDEGVRKALNFGHTIGHALESLYMGSENPLLHGEAVLHGMIIETRIANLKKLISVQGLEFEENEILGLLSNDKKTSGKTLRFSLINGIGSCSVDVNVSLAQIRSAMAYYRELLS
jgi:3-dehydroquinate synthase